MKIEHEEYATIRSWSFAYKTDPTIPAIADIAIVRTTNAIWMVKPLGDMAVRKPSQKAGGKRLVAMLVCGRVVTHHHQICCLGMDKQFGANQLEKDSPKKHQFIKIIQHPGKSRAIICCHMLQL